MAKIMIDTDRLDLLLDRANRYAMIENIVDEWMQDFSSNTDYKYMYGIKEIVHPGGAHE